MTSSLDDAKLGVDASHKEHLSPFVYRRCFAAESMQHGSETQVSAFSLYLEKSLVLIAPILSGPILASSRLRVVVAWPESRFHHTSTPALVRGGRSSSPPSSSGASGRSGILGEMANLAAAPLMMRPNHYWPTP